MELGSLVVTTVGLQLLSARTAAPQVFPNWLDMRNRTLNMRFYSVLRVACKVTTW
jgi:hypothetical protein